MFVGCCRAQASTTHPNVSRICEPCHSVCSECCKHPAMSGIRAQREPFANGSPHSVSGSICLECVFYTYLYQLRAVRTQLGSKVSSLQACVFALLFEALERICIPFQKFWGKLLVRYCFFANPTDEEGR